MKLLLDTCALIWFAQGVPDLSCEAYDAIVRADAQVHVSVVSAMEIACLADRGRIELTEHWRHWWREQLRVNGWACLPITLDIAEEAYLLPSPIHRDPCDRLIIATSRLDGMTIVTGDRLILDYPHVRTMQ